MKSKKEILYCINSRQSKAIDKAKVKIMEVRNECERMGLNAYSVALESIDKLMELQSAIWAEYDKLK